MRIGLEFIRTLFRRLLYIGIQSKNDMSQYSFIITKVIY